MSATRLNPSIDEMARDARALAGIGPHTILHESHVQTWRAKFRAMLACYGWKVVKAGQVYFVGKHTVLEDWQIERV